MAGKHCLPDTLAGADPQAPVQTNRDLRHPLAKAPDCAAITLLVNDCFVRSQVGGDLRRPPRRQISGRRNHLPLALTNSAGNHGGIGKLTSQKRDVDAGGDEVDVAVIQIGIDIERRVLSQEGRKAGHNM